MNYNDALRYIGSRLRFGIKPGLDRIRRLLCRLGEPQKQLRFIHVAGTNGKGSTCTMTAAGLMAAGHKTGLYTSPYICDFRERIQINGQMIPKADLARLTEQAAAIIDDEDETTEFEVITCIAMLWYAEQKCDYVVLETGLGGRLDATNAIDAPLAAAITRIDLDHTAILGENVAQIAGEKAGIIKSGSRVVIQPGQPADALAVLCDCCADKGIIPVIPDRGCVKVLDRSIEGTDILYGNLALRIPLVGDHQIDNAITAVELLRICGIEDEAIVGGIARAFIPARMELIAKKPTVILDGAHNPNGAQALAAAVKKLMTGREVIAVMGVLRDKDYRCELGMLGPLFSRIYCTDGFSDRCQTAAELASVAGECSCTVTCDTPEQAVDMALGYAAEHDAALVVCGSLYLAGRVRPYLLDKTHSTT